MTYQIDEPIETFFVTVEDIVKVAELEIKPYSAEQIVDISYIIITKIISSEASFVNSCQ